LNQHRPTIEEHSCGIIPLRQGEGGYEIFLIQHYRGHWGFPKGLMESGEEPQQTAERELFEETALSVTNYLSLTPIVEDYYFRTARGFIHKTVTYFVAYVQGEPKLQESEVKAGQWVTIDKVLDYLYFPSSKTVFNKALDILEHL
jgi:8-oxo-dGTP pyrophosphatase MutT (NUDIX family)